MSDSFKVSKKKNGQEPATSRRRKVLVVDDDADILILLSAMLEIGDYDSVIAASGDEAERVFASESIDLILLDLIMPGRNGLELIDCFRAINTTIPIIMITGCGKVEHAIESFKKGVVDFMAKPVTPEKLFAVLDRAFQRLEPSEVGVPLSKIPRISGYRFVRVLGEGNMGIVYKVESNAEQGGVREYALKVLKLSGATDEKTAYTLRHRFMNEAKAIFAIQHPNIIKVYDYGTDEDNVPFILMELSDGVPLDIYARENPLTVEEKCHVLKQVAFALATIHDNDICHRDIKPSNILIDNQLNVKVMDFGIARIKDSTLTPTCHVFGTPAFLAPEAFVTSKVDHRSDIFSFGVLAYQLFTGQLPFDADTVAGLAKQIRKDEPVWPRKLGIKLPRKLENHLKRMLVKSPDKRFDNAFELFEIFDAFSGQSETFEGW